MAGYMAAQALVKTLLSGVSGLQVTEGDYSVLDEDMINPPYSSPDLSAGTNWPR